MGFVHVVSTAHLVLHTANGEWGLVGYRDCSWALQFDLRRHGGSDAQRRLYSTLGW